MGEGQYITGPPPKEVEPDYDGVAEPQRVRGSNKRTTRKKPTPSVEPSSNDEEWLKELGIGGSGSNLLGLLDGQGGGGESQSIDARTTFPGTNTSLPPPPPLPRADSSSSFTSYQSLPPPQAYGVYFVPKDSEKASFVGTTHYPPSFANSTLDGINNHSPYPNQSRGSISSEIYSQSPFAPSVNLQSFTSPDSLSSVSSIATSGPPPTPPDVWNTSRSNEKRKVRETVQANGTQGLYQGFHRAVSRAFGKGQESEMEQDLPFVSRSASQSSSSSTTSATVTPTDPLPTIRLPRFSSGLPGSASSITSPSTDDYLHISRAFDKLSRFLNSSSTSSSRRLSPLDLVNMLQAQEERNSLLSSRPETFDFSKPPTCLFLPPFSFSPSSQPPQPVSGKKEIYVLAEAVESVQIELEKTGCFA